MRILVALLLIQTAQAAPTFYEAMETGTYLPMEAGPLDFPVDIPTLTGVCLAESEGHRGREHTQFTNGCGGKNAESVTENKLKDVRSQMLLVVLCRNHIGKNRGTGFKDPKDLGDSALEQRALRSCKEAARETTDAFAKADERAKDIVCRKTHFFHRCYQCKNGEKNWTIRSTQNWVLTLEADPARLDCSRPVWDSGNGGQWCETCRNSVAVK